MKRQLKILLLSSGFFTLAGGLIGPIYAMFVEEIGGDLLAAGSAFAAFSIAAGLLIFFVSRWEDHVKHQERLVILGWGLCCLGFYGYMLVERPWHLAVVQVIFGIGTAVNTPAYDGLYSKYLDKGRFASEWGAWESMYYIVTAVAALMGSAVADIYGFGGLFKLMFFLSLVGFGISLLLLRH